MRSFTVSADGNLRDFTDCAYPQGSFYFSALLRGKDIKVNGVRVSKNVRVKAGDEIVYYTSQKQENAESHKIVYEDENVLVADKFSGVTSEGLFSELCCGGEFYAVHRLDRNTRGLIVYAKTAAAEKALLAAFRERGVEKTYVALCKNGFVSDSATLTAYLVKDEKNSSVKVYGKEIEGGAKIITQYKVLKKRGDVAVVEIILHTGKTHQIRAHMAYIGCPVLGDEKYGDSELNKKYGLKRQCLIAKYLTFGKDMSLPEIGGRTFESSFILPELND